MKDNNCVDIDECEEMTHSCHPSSTCVNTDGHFECQCTNLHSARSSLNTLKSRGDSSNECKLSCMFENNEIADQSQIRPRNQPCSVCTCSKGVITCAEPPCDCSKWRKSEDRELCCPQCDPKESCQHQELKHVTFKSGEQWIYQCQTCECLVSMNVDFNLVNVLTGVVHSMVNSTAGRWNALHWRARTHYL